MTAIPGAPVPSMRGENNAQAVLTWEKVHIIRREYAAGATTQRQLAERFGVSRRAVYAILRNIKWHDPAYTPLPQHRQHPTVSRETSEAP
jgi:DNA-binding GntR family transcriptional regulator